jgi:type 1 glutamine amidotransferase
MAAAVSAALIVAPAAWAQAPDTTAPTLSTSTSPSAPPQRAGNPPAEPSTSTGNNNWFNHDGPTILSISATDDVGVTSLQYSVDNGDTWVDLPVAGGDVEVTAEGTNNVRVRAFDAAGNLTRGSASNTSLDQPAAAGATAIRLRSTNGRAAGDDIAIGDETLKIVSVVSPNPPSPQPNVTLSAPLANDYAARTLVQTFPQYVTVPIRIDTQPPTATFPSVTDTRIGHSATVTPTRTDPSPGSGGTAVRDTWIDGTWSYPLPLDASSLSLGKHTWSLALSDTAGNGSKVTLTFLVTTSFADLDSMLTRYATAGNVPSDTIASLRDKLSAAQAADAAGDKPGAIASLESFGSEARGILDAKARDLLIADSQDVIRQVRGIPDAPAPDDLGVTSEPFPGAGRHVYEAPAMPEHNANATFKVLVISNRQDGFRHPAIEDATVLIQKLGRERGFDVDLWDYAYTDQSLPDTPFTSAANLAQYAVIIGNSSVGNNTFRTNYTMNDGTVVDEQAAFKGYINNGGGFVALHGADDSMHNWSWYQDFLGGLFVSHPSNANGFLPDCGSCYFAELITEDPSHPATRAAGKPDIVPISDELYHFDRKPRPFVHPLMRLNEDTYRTAIGVNGTGGNNPALEGADHPITWCSNYDGGREFTQVLGHNWQLFDDTPWFQESLYQGILTAAGFKYANCVTHREVRELIAASQAAGGLTADAATAATGLVDSAYDKYAALTLDGYSASLGDIDALRTLAQDPASGDAAARAELLAKTQELKRWMQTLLGATDSTGGVSGTVPATLSLTLGAPASFGAFVPGVAGTYTASTTANVISTAGDAVLSVADPSSTATGRLVNGSFALATPVAAKATSPLGAGLAFAAVGGSSSPTSLLTYSGPVSNDTATVTFEQAIGADEPLRTGSYSKTLTLTLSTTAP